MEKYSKDSPISYCFGTTLTFELLLRKPTQARRIYISPKQKRDDTYKRLTDLANKNGVEIILNNEKIFRQLSGKDNTMVIGEFAKFTPSFPLEKNHIVLVNPSNMGNLGTIFRSGAAFSIGGIAIIRPAADCFDPKCIRSSMGAIFSLPFAYFDSFEEYKEKTKDHHFYPLMLQAKTSIKDIVAVSPYSLIFGNEATGLPSSFLDVGTPIIIPQNSEIDSLNLDNAVSISLFAFLEQ